ncbi:MAG: endo-1,4-beta-xylanase, partial [Oscillospiraceae bacterium]|nr:endo-1,4-beta-xylanase [Oscillospiraceae bacterium]
MAKTLRRVLALLLAASLLAGMFPLVSAAEERVVVPLKDVYAGRFMIGTVMNPRDSGAKLEFIRTHFNALTPENNTKPDNIWNSPSGNPNFSQTDTMVSARKADGFYTIGHALAWHNQSSNWPSPGLTYEEARAQLERYISAIAGHFYENESIRFDAWDVVNEAMRDNPENPTDWRNALRHGDLPIERPAKWYAAYANGGNGWDYVYDAFQFARKYAPNALLNYNDFNDEELPSKAIAIASMVTELNQRYAEEHPEDPRKLIESIGIQGHYSTRLNTDNLEQVLRIYAATGCRICVTELDVQCNGTVGRTLTEEQQREQAIVYAKLFMLYKKYDKFIDRVTFWGTDDSSNWRSSQRPMLFDVNREPKEAYWAAIDPEGYLGLGKEAPRLDAISYGGQSLDCSRYEVDVSLPKDVSEITFSAENAVHGYDPSQVQVTVEMEDNTVPCTAKVKIAWADTPQSCNEYTVNFGHMTAEWLNDVNYPDTGYRSSVRIRFSDGESKYQLRQSFTSEGSYLNTLAEIDPPAKNGSGVYWVETQAKLDDEFLRSVTLKKSLLDGEDENVIPARITSFSKPERFYRLADAIEPGKTYIIVSSATGKAFTHKALQPVPAGGNLTESKAGYEGTDVTVEDGIIVGPSLIQDNIRFIFLPRESPDAGEYSGGFNMLSLVHGGLIQPFIIWRENVSTPTAGLYSNATISDADLDRAVWFNTGFDPETHETTLFLHSASKGLTYVLTGNENGFAAQGGSGTIDEYKSLGRVKLYEYVETYTEDTECEHDYKAVVTAPTCTEKGYTTHTCAKCGLSYTYNWTDALGHDWDDGAVTKPPTETASGVMTYSCRRCGETRTERIPRTGTGGWTLADSVEAGKQYVIVSNGYALTNKVAQVSTAYGGTSLASTPVTVDDGVITSEVSDEMIWDFGEGTSAVAGEYTTGYFLTNADSKYLARNGPTNGNPAPLNTETYDASNVATKPQYCYWIVRDLDGQGNKAVFLAASGEWSFALRGSVEGFDAPGNANTDTVTAANPVRLYELSGSSPMPPAADKYALRAAIATAEAVDTGKYTEASVAAMNAALADARAALSSDLQRVVDEATEALKAAVEGLVLDCEHDYQAVVKAPTCTEPGYTTYTCSKCGDSYRGDEVPAFGHDWGEGEVTTQPTESSSGIRTYTCSRCGEKRTEVIPKLDHEHQYTAVVTQPTCTDKGFTVYTCISCGK